METASHVRDHLRMNCWSDKRACFKVKKRHFLRTVVSQICRILPCERWDRSSYPYRSTVGHDDCNEHSSCQLSARTALRVKDHFHTTLLLRNSRVHPQRGHVTLSEIQGCVIIEAIHVHHSVVHPIKTLLTRGSV